MPVALDASEALNVLAAWAACGVCLVRDTGSAGGSVLQLDLVSGMPRLQAAGRFLAPAGRYFPALLPEAAPQERLAELAVGELARGGRWVKVIADFPPVTDGMPSGPPELTYSGEAIKAMIAAVHAAGGRVAAHVTTDVVTELVRAGVDSIEHGTATDEPALRLMAQTGLPGRLHCARCSAFLILPRRLPGGGSPSTGSGFVNCCRSQNASACPYWPGQTPPGRSPVRLRCWPGMDSNQPPPSRP
jgi:hypothetical protein